ncbi:hypothetical protein WR25_12065 [Diploscapter pachys]|uniref:Cytochrome b-c1 complex subunit 8 n=1 Tax=Diploscapter pachys TaxID=2018661 RepID=A0A2A2LRE2_9BILA|nr:hypothetical protein WR25_12065 [Diploscapter pachys]
MRSTAIAMGKHFGNLGKMYGEYRFSLAPNEQSVWKGFFKGVIVNNFKNYFVYQWHYFLPQAIGFYMLYDWANKANAQSHRKNPADYANDK